MAPLTLLDFVNLFFAGMLAGVEFVIHYGVRVPAETLDDRSQLQFRQALILKLRVLVPALFLPAALAGIVLTALGAAAPGFLFRCVGLGALLIWAMIRVIGTVPINSATLTWQLSMPPTNWKAQVMHAERFHIVGVWAAVLAFVCALAAVALTLAIH